jgi:hypothetical protein
MRPLSIILICTIVLAVICIVGSELLSMALPLVAVAP